jgi:cell division protein FtsB
MEIQTSLRRDIERLRLDMLRQFVTFRNEIGQKWEGEVDRLRAENDSLKGEMEKLRKERRERDDERNRWRLV